MNPTYNDLRSYRKSSCLTQQDVAELIGTKDISQISRYETCPISPQTEISLFYHIIFNVPMSHFFLKSKDELKKRLKHRIPQIIHDLKCSAPSVQVNNKLQFLEELLSTLTAQDYE